MESNYPDSDPPSPPTRTKSAPATFYGGALAAASSSAPPSVPSPPPPPKRTIDNQGEPDDNLGAPDDDIKNPDSFRSLNTCVTLLMSPSSKAWHPKDYKGQLYNDRVLIELGWVKSKVSEKHFIFDPAKGRSVLRNDSKIRTHGLAYGLPRRYWEWLCGMPVSNAPLMVTKEALWIDRRDFVRQSVA